MTTRPTLSTTRRDLLKGLSVASLGLGTLSPAGMAASTEAASPSYPELDLSSPAGLLEASVKMRGTTDGQLAFIWLRGLRYTLVDGVATPLCGYLGGSITRYRQLADDAFEFLLYEVSYYTDLETGEVLETLQMPHTNKTVNVPLYRTGPGRHVIMMSNEEELAWNKDKTTSEELANQLAPDAKIFYRFDLRPAISLDDQVWIRSDSFTRMVPMDPSVTGMFYKEGITYQAPRAALARPGATQVDASVSFAIATAWRPWMQMGDTNGHTMTDGIGGKALEMAAMPPDFLRFTEQYHPDVLANPARLLEV